MSNNLSSEVLFDEVIVYEKALPDTSTLIRILEESKQKDHTPDSFFEEWKGWYGFGDQVGMPWLPFATLDEVLDGDHAIDGSGILEGEDEQRYFAKTITSVFYAITKDYLSRTTMAFPDMSSMGIAVCRYDETGSREFGMSYHTDYVQSKSQDPGYKFAITCTMYLNDNYEGGEISFLDSRNTKVIEYAPSAGDVVFFPSGEPYYHGVNTIPKGEKYIVRLFWGYDFPGTEEWHNNEKKYGKEEWAAICSSEVKRHFHEGTYHREVVWDSEELKHSRFVIGENPTVVPFLSNYPIVKKGRGHD